MNYKITDLETDEIIGLLTDEELYGSVYTLIFEDLYKNFKKNKANFHFVINMGWALTQIEQGVFSVEQVLECFNLFFQNAYKIEKTEMSEEEFELIETKRTNDLLS